ncbi:hypothetical protein MTO96_021995 [Rhipicephalus appendiculatus]
MGRTPDYPVIKGGVRGFPCVSRGALHSGGRAYGCVPTAAIRYRRAALTAVRPRCRSPSSGTQLRRGRRSAAEQEDHRNKLLHRGGIAGAQPDLWRSSVVPWVAATLL